MTESDLGEPPCSGGSETETRKGVPGHWPHGVAGQDRVASGEGEGEETPPDVHSAPPRQQRQFIASLSVHTCHLCLDFIFQFFRYFNQKRFNYGTRKINMLFKDFGK